MTTQIFRFKFTESFISELNAFAKVHENDDRHDFKTAWHKWTEEHYDIVQNEIDILTRLGYDGDIMQKMFVSARYYYRKKDSNTKDKEQKKRRSYINVSTSLLCAIDNHITTHKKDEGFQPKTGFQQFCDECKDILVEEIKNLYLGGMTEPSEIQEKVKKTYNNRYFMLSKK